MRAGDAGPDFAFAATPVPARENRDPIPRLASALKQKGYRVGR